MIELRGKEIRAIITVLPMFQKLKERNECVRNMHGRYILRYRIRKTSRDENYNTLDESN